MTPANRNTPIRNAILPVNTSNINEGNINKDNINHNYFRGNDGTHLSSEPKKTEKYRASNDVAITNRIHIPPATRYRGQHHI